MALAVVKYPSSISQDDPNYRGAIFYNPGGPGESGVDLFLSSVGPMLAKMFGPAYDFISWDPRGESSVYFYL